jgi:hypothetical protein
MIYIQNETQTTIGKECLKFTEETLRLNRKDEYYDTDEICKEKDKNFTYYFNL